MLSKSKMKNKILLLNPNWRHLEKVGRMSKITSGIPLELLYIAGSLKKLNLEFKIIDLWGSDKNLQDFKPEISDASIIVINTAPSYLYWRDGTIDCELPRKIVQEVRAMNPQIKIIVIGPHGTVLPESIASKDIDYLIRGEPDLIAAKLIEKIIKNKIGELKGVCEWQGKKFHVSKDYATVNNLDEVDAPYEILDIKNYSIPEYPKKDRKKITTYYEASRGCPFDCIFCFREGFRGKLRFKSLKKISADLGKLKKLGVGYIYFIDECFGFDIPWFRKLLGILKKYRIEWGCQTRPHLWNKKRIIEAAKNGCVLMEMGIESANKRVLNALNKESTDLSVVKENVNTMLSFGITPGLSFIVGSPYETKETIKEIKDFLLQFPADKVLIGCHIMLPYPKTKLWNLGLKEGIPLHSWPDVRRYAGVIHNDFKEPKEVNLEIKRLLSYLRVKKAASRMRAALKERALANFMKNFIILVGSKVIIALPRITPLFEKTMNLFKSGKFATNDYL
ncbi:MAG: B12-binding domain-containing radical SAM protein [archaeon]